MRPYLPFRRCRKEEGKEGRKEFAWRASNVEGGREGERRASNVEGGREGERRTSNVEGKGEWVGKVEAKEWTARM
jgi:hypothetical protein